MKEGKEASAKERDFKMLTESSTDLILCFIFSIPSSMVRVTQHGNLARQLLFCPDIKEKKDSRIQLKERTKGFGRILKDRKEKLLKSVPG